jgi:predicted nucleic acid-binding Zn ribbon protein
MPIDPALRRLIASFRKSPNWDSDLDLEVLQKLWPTLVGPKLAGATTITAVQGSRVVVNVPDLIWRKQLVKMRPQLLAKMNEPWATPWIKEIAFTYENQ